MRIRFEPRLRGTPSVQRAGRSRSLKVIEPVLNLPNIKPVEPVQPISPLAQEMAARNINNEREAENGTLKGKRFAIMNNLAKTFT